MLHRRYESIKNKVFNRYYNCKFTKSSPHNQAPTKSRVTRWDTPSNKPHQPSTTTPNHPPHTHAPYTFIKRVFNIHPSLLPHSQPFPPRTSVGVLEYSPRNTPVLLWKYSSTAPRVLEYFRRSTGTRCLRVQTKARHTRFRSSST